MKVVLTRLVDNGAQTLGELNVYDGHKKVMSCKTLELPWRDNKRRVSCIPKDSYKVALRPEGESQKYTYPHYHVQNVPTRSWILIHAGNYHTQILGCILVGRTFADLNRDGQLDVTSSRDALAELLEVLGDEFILEII